MHIVAAFEYSLTLEMALKKIEQNGIAMEDIIAVPLDRRIERTRLFDTLHRSDGKSLMDISAVFGAVFMLLGTIYGYVMSWGPILWGLIGLVLGLVFGFVIDWLHTKKEVKRTHEVLEKSTEVFVTVKCSDRKEMEMVENIFWEHFALGIGKLV